MTYGSYMHRWQQCSSSQEGREVDFDKGRKPTPGEKYSRQLKVKQIWPDKLIGWNWNSRLVNLFLGLFLKHAFLFVGKRLKRSFWSGWAGEHSQRGKGDFQNVQCLTIKFFSQLRDIVVIRVPEERQYCDFMIIATGRNTRHVRWPIVLSSTIDFHFTFSVVSSVVLSVYKSKMASSDPVPRRWNHFATELEFKTTIYMQGRCRQPLLWLDSNGHGKYCTSPARPGALDHFHAGLRYLRQELFTNMMLVPY